MIDFYKHKDDCLHCYEAEELLKKIVVSHKVFLIGDCPSHSEPTVIEGKKLVKGHAAIKEYLDELEETVFLWNQFQGDSCYIDKNKKTC